MNKIEKFIIDNTKTLFIVCGIILAILFIALGVALNTPHNKISNATNADTSTNASSNVDTSESITTTFVEQTDATTESTTLEETSESVEETTTEKIEETTTSKPIVVDYPYLIKVNRAANCTTVYAKDKNGLYTVPVKAMTVSCGLNIDDTPIGEYNTITNYEWRLLFGNVYGHYSYRIVGHTLFHSVPYYSASNDDLEWEEYNKLGYPASQGCIRMTVADAKWLVDNCPIGTTVIIYDDAADPGPLGKPDTIKIPADSPYRGWDPTDPNPNNPWHKYTACITYPSSKVVTVTEGSDVEKVLSRFKAKDTCGNDISKKLQLAGDYNLNVAGTYNVIVNVTDAIGRYVEIDITLEVKAKEIETTTEKATMDSSTTETTTEKITTDSTETSESDSSNESTNESGETETAEDETTSGFRDFIQ